MKKLYVGNLPFSATDDSLRQLFAEHGEVASATVIKDKFSGRSKGFGFVEMPNDEEADKAMNAKNGFEVDGRKLTVNEARPMEDRPKRDFGGDRGGYNRRDR